MFSLTYIIIIFVIILLTIFLVRKFADLDQDIYSAIRNYFGKGVANLSGKRVWLIGCSQGIGEDIAYRLARANCDLILSARSKDKLRIVAKACQSFKASNGAMNKPKVLPLDLLNFASHEDFASQVVRERGDVDYLIICAGRTQRSLICDTTMEIDKATIELNTLGPISITKAMLPHFEAKKSGHIVLISSIAAKIPSPVLGSYATSKAALNGFFHTLTAETTYKLNITMVHPGPIYTGVEQEVFRNDLQNSHAEKYLSEKTAVSITSQRCADIIASAMGNNLIEIWITRNPILAFTYFFQYAPGLLYDLSYPFLKKKAQLRVKAFKEGKIVNAAI